jgi:hypothetical protein
MEIVINAQCQEVIGMSLGCANCEGGATFLDCSNHLKRERGWDFRARGGLGIVTAMNVGTRL